MCVMFAFAAPFNGDLSKWDVSSVTDMSLMFFHTDFNGDLSKWDVSSVTTMSEIFAWATSFNGNISKWDVSSVTTMSEMFAWATSFNGDLSNWDVSSVSNMSRIFCEATSFKQKLCGAAWARSRAIKTLMFARSSGSVCTLTALFSSKKELKSAVDACLKLDPKGDCSTGLHGPIAEWDVSRVTDMSRIFADAKSFTGELSKWDVSRVTTMSGMFAFVAPFNGDLSKWDVSSVTDMSLMFFRADSTVTSRRGTCRA